jgi:hypothetical protein
MREDLEGKSYDRLKRKKLHSTAEEEPNVDYERATEKRCTFVFCLVSDRIVNVKKIKEIVVGIG